MLGHASIIYTGVLCQGVQEYNRQSDAKTPTQVPSNTSNTHTHTQSLEWLQATRNVDQSSRHSSISLSNNWLMAVTLIIDWLSVLIKHNLTFHYVWARGLLPTTEEFLVNRTHMEAISQSDSGSPVWYFALDYKSMSRKILPFETLSWWWGDILEPNSDEHHHEYVFIFTGDSPNAAPKHRQRQKMH